MPHFLAMMVRAPRAVDLVANSELAICSLAAEVGSLAFTATLGPLAATCGPLGVAPVNSPPDTTARGARTIMARK